MSISCLIQKWSAIDATSKVVIITDHVQEKLAAAIKDEGIYQTEIMLFSPDEPYQSTLSTLTGHDLVIVLLTIDTYVYCGANEFFSPFSKPDWLRAKYIFARLDITPEALTEGLSTDKHLVHEKIREMNHYADGCTLHVRNESGTDISFKIMPFTTCSHEITQDGGCAFLPPSETSSDLITDSANGKIVVDMTVGQLYHYGTLVDYFGLVDVPVTLMVEHGIITDIQGGPMADSIKDKLFALPDDCRRIVELGQGLSRMTPTGLIGIDESILDSCHFGFGDAGSCGTHWDVVIANPTITQINELS